MNQRSAQITFNILAQAQKEFEYPHHGQCNEAYFAPILLSHMPNILNQHQLDIRAPHLLTSADSFGMQQNHRLTHKHTNQKHLESKEQRARGVR
jgi:hypothetical protein